MGTQSLKGTLLTIKELNGPSKTHKVFFGFYTYREQDPPVLVPTLTLPIPALPVTVYNTTSQYQKDEWSQTLQQRKRQREKKTKG